MYQDRIQEARVEAQQANVANKIIDMLDKLRLSSNENSPRRWIWELMQNAKDVTNSTGKVKINIFLDINNNLLRFCHNGKPFTTKNLVYLIEQVSTKERNSENNEEKKSGKFGTGFLTTHLLSEKVKVMGILADEQTKVRSFEILLDRSGKNKEEIIKAIQLSYSNLNQSTELPDCYIFDENEYNTIFEYKLDEKGIEVAKIGLEDLKISIPYVLSIVPEIDEVYVESSETLYKRANIFQCGLQGLKAYEIQMSDKTSCKKEFIVSLCESNITIAVAVEYIEGKRVIKAFDKYQPRIFCDFPLIGTYDFAFPVIVNSSSFNPTEPRDGIFLTNNDNEKVNQNKDIMVKACDLFAKLLEYVAEKQWDGLYNISAVKKVYEKDWFDRGWINENIIKRCKDIIGYTDIIDTAEENRLAFYDIQGNEQIFIITAQDEKTRNSLWELENSLYPTRIPCKKDIHNWYNSLWNECHNFGINELTRQLESYGDMNTLASVIHVESNKEWLSKYYEMVCSNEKLWNDIMISRNLE